MNSCSEDIRDMLLSYLGESDSDFALFEIAIGKEPEAPADIITIVDTVGFTPQLNYDKTEKYEYPSIQLRVRANHYVDGWKQIEQIKEALHGRAGETWNGTFYSVIYCQNGPFLFDYDKNQRPRFIINFNIQRR
jgi:hypothetical protein